MEFISVKEIGCDGKIRWRKILMRAEVVREMDFKNKHYIVCDLNKENRFYENIHILQNRFDKKTKTFSKNPSTHYLPLEAEKKHN